jgi:hypothetical protein
MCVLQTKATKRNQQRVWEKERERERKRSQITLEEKAIGLTGGDKQNAMVSKIAAKHIQ